MKGKVMDERRKENLIFRKSKEELVHELGKLREGTHKEGEKLR